MCRSLTGSPPSSSIEMPFNTASLYELPFCQFMEWYNLTVIWHWEVTRDMLT